MPIVRSDVNEKMPMSTARNEFPITEKYLRRAHKHYNRCLLSFSRFPVCFFLSLTIYFSVVLQLRLPENIAGLADVLSLQT